MQRNKWLCTTSSHLREFLCEKRCSGVNYKIQWCPINKLKYLNVHVFFFSFILIQLPLQPTHFRFSIVSRSSRKVPTDCIQLFGILANLFCNSFTPRKIVYIRELTHSSPDLTSSRKLIVNIYRRKITQPERDQLMFLQPKTIALLSRECSRSYFG